MELTGAVLLALTAFVLSFGRLGSPHTHPVLKASAQPGEISRSNGAFAKCSFTAG
ncbi:hypothetical protein ACQPXS_47635 (plasmid) [Streptomyces sp. CA-142005]|uniref:hypothetical protein n=1 Tax=Streptomyces sp. CA-142005 TaxID=3240052 RepID=UPI003D900C83